MLFLSTPTSSRPQAQTTCHSCWLILFLLFWSFAFPLLFMHGFFPPVFVSPCYFIIPYMYLIVSFFMQVFTISPCIYSFNLLIYSSNVQSLALKYLWETGYLSSRFWLSSRICTPRCYCCKLLILQVERVSHRDNLRTFIQKSEDVEKRCLAKAIKSYCELRIFPYEANKTVVFRSWLERKLW